MAAPSVTSVTPNETPEMVPVQVIIAGNDFTGATAVTVGGHAATSYTVNSSIQITATLPAHAAEADLQVQVTTSQGASANVAADNFTYYQDEISVERSDGDNESYVEVYSGPWVDAEWEDDDVFVDATTYYYQATRTVKGETSGYSNEDSVVYAEIGAPSGTGYYYKVLYDI